MYDFPQALVYANEFNEKYEVTNETRLEDLPKPGRALLQKMEQNPPWSGFYYLLLDGKDREKILQAKRFVDIRKGELWRLITPAFLHIELLHLLFNMLWLFILGKMLEKNVKILPYIIFIAVTAAVTNTLQYLMTGPFFMGFSGVVSAMAGYIWMRKKYFTEENYPIDSISLTYLWIYIFGMLCLQIVAFFLEILHIFTFKLIIANTAHVSGVLLGMLIGRVNVFQRKM